MVVKIEPYPDGKFWCCREIGTDFFNVYRTQILDELRERFGELHKLTGSQSLFTLGEDAARIYVRYSKVHLGGRTFFGLREVDLRQLEGHNAFICFLLDDGSPALFVPYADFEEVFRSAETAKAGQYKVQLIPQRGALDLYAARQGRFNIEGYAGFDTLARSLDAKRLREARDLTHSQVQTLLASIGRIKGYAVRVPENDVGKLDWPRRSTFREHCEPAGESSRHHPPAFHALESLTCQSGRTSGRS